MLISQLVFVAAPLAAKRISSADGVYNSSTTPGSLTWDTYNYCNAPHVNREHYSKPDNASDVELVYLNVMMRHHKRTPDNLYPDENALNPPSGWNCTNFLQYSYGGGTANVYHETYIPSDHPFLNQIWNGTCDQGQLTQEGLEDAIKHGKDFWSVYHETLGFLEDVDPNNLYVRTSTETRTFQVAGAMLYGMDPWTANGSFAVYTQPENIDSLVPDYSCSAADNIRSAYQSVSNWTDHLNQNQALQQSLGDITGTAGMDAWTSWYDHYFDTFSSRTCHGHPLPCNATRACVSEDQASQVFSIGDWEYNYIWNAAQNASTYVQSTFGVMFSELAQNFKSFQSGAETYKARLYVGHDGSLIRLASGLGLGKSTPLRWPAMGSEIVMEVWRTQASDHYVRVMHEGTPVDGLEWVSMDDFIDLLQSQVPDDIFSACDS